MNKDIKLMNHYPDGFRARRGLNWVSIGLLYATFYMCRYNFKMATPGIRSELGFDIAMIWSWWSIAYGTGQLVNGLFADKIGGRKCMLIGGVGTIIVSLLIGFSPMVQNYSSFVILMMLNAYLQSFGAPGFVKINAAWFRRNERGTFAGIFGGMIQLGQFSIFSLLGPWILGGIAFLSIGKGEWRYLFVLPPLLTAMSTLFFFFAVKETPDDAGHEGVIEDELDNSKGVKMPLGIVFKTIFTNPFIWFYAIAYMATGAARHGTDQLGNLFFTDILGFDMKSDLPKIAVFTLGAIPIVGFLGSLISGFISDKFFGGKRGPVSMVLYFIVAFVMFNCAYMTESSIISSTFTGAMIGCLVIILISMSVNATHSLVGAAAPMDIGGKKMAGFASGVIDSFQYYGSAIALVIVSYFMKPYRVEKETGIDEFGKPIIEIITQRTGWVNWFIIMGIFSLVGAMSMFLLNKKHKRLDALKA